MAPDPDFYPSMRKVWILMSSVPKPRHSAEPEPPVLGPYHTERDTFTAPLHLAWRGLHDEGLVHSGDPQGVARGMAVRHLHEACRNAGVGLGAYDDRILVWLARGDLGPIAVVIGLLSRAYAAGMAAGRAAAGQPAPAPDELGAWPRTPTPWTEGASHDEACPCLHCNVGTSRARHEADS